MGERLQSRRQSAGEAWQNAEVDALYRLDAPALRVAKPTAALKAWLADGVCNGR